MSTLAVIPARYGSTRLPGKPLVPIDGIPLVLRVLDGVRATPGLDEIVVATDDGRIAKIVRDHGGKAVMTPPDLPIESTSPRPLERAAHLFMVMSVLWGILSLLALGTAEHRQ